MRKFVYQEAHTRFGLYVRPSSEAVAVVLTRVSVVLIDSVEIPGINKIIIIVKILQ